MDASRYARVRELFLEAEELPRDQQEEFVRGKTTDDVELFAEVISLLREHDADSARHEGDREIRVPSVGGIDDSGLSEASVSDSDDGLRPQQQSSLQTQTGAQRTHAAPRGMDGRYEIETPQKKSARSVVWNGQSRKTRRINTGWLWLAAILPTVIVGLMTYRKVDAMLRAAVADEMSVRVDSVALAVDRFLDDQSSLIRSWSRQPAIRRSVIELVKLSTSENATDRLANAAEASAISQQLQDLSGHADVKFVVWNREQRVVASSGGSDATVGSEVSRGSAAKVTLAFRGETVLYGPALSLDFGVRDFTDDSTPVMASLVPVYDDTEAVVAVMLVSGIGMFEKFNDQFRTSSIATGHDAYAVSTSGKMVTQSVQAETLAQAGRLGVDPQNITAELRVCDPGVLMTDKNSKSVSRSTRPLTFAAAGVTSKINNILVDPYPNYAGIEVIGGWRWLGQWEIGVIAERPAIVAFGPARVVRYGFLALTALLTITAIASATIIARRTSEVQAAGHPLNRYEIMGELGTGGMGIVYRALHKQLGRETALKVLRADRQHREDRLRFDREAKLAASLTNPHSVLVYDYGEINETETFCVMELLQGLTLYEVVARGGYQSIGRVLFVLRQICDSIGEAHQLGLMHRDLKPQNVMLSMDPSVGDWAVVFDFGLAKPLEHDPGVFNTSETIWAGTPMYMAPERFREPSVLDPRSDIYSIGCIAYFLLSGRPPFAECDPESMFALILSEHPIQISTHRGEAVPREINELVRRCMAKNATERYSRVDEISAKLDELRTLYPWSPVDAASWWSIHGGS